MADLSEALFQATEILIDKKLESVHFDETIKATIVDDSKADSGIYTVDAGNVRYQASSSGAKYKAKDVVMVTIPQGNYDNQKIIIGKYVEKDDQAVHVVMPFETLINDTGNLITNITEAIPMKANDVTSSWPMDVNFEQVYNNTDFRSIYLGQHSNPIWSLQRDATNAISLSGYTRIGLQAQFQSFLADYNTMQGNYGLALVVTFTDQEGQSNIFLGTFDSDEFVGYPYGFDTYYTQEKVFDISGYVDRDVTNIELFVYQRSNFATADGTAIEDTDALDSLLSELGSDFTNKVPDIWVKDCLVCFGYDSSEFSKDTASLFSASTETYAAGRTYEDNRKFVELHWVHKDEENNRYYRVVGDNKDTNIPSGYEVRWYRHRVGATVNTEDPYGGPHWEPFITYKNEDDKGKNIINNYIDYGNSYKNGVGIVEYISNLYKILFNRNIDNSGQNTYLSNQKIVTYTTYDSLINVVKSLVNSDEFKNVNFQDLTIEENNENSYYSNITDDEKKNIINKFYKVLLGREPNNNEEEQNSIIARANLIDINIENFTTSLWNIIDNIVDPDNDLETPSESTNYFDNIILENKNTAIITVDDNGNEIIAQGFEKEETVNNLQVYLYPDISFEDEQLKVVILKYDEESKEYKKVLETAPIVFTNANEVANKQTLIDSNALSIVFEDDSYNGNYFYYNRAGHTAKEQDGQMRILRPVFSEDTDVINEKPDLTDFTSLKWIVPVTNTMIRPAGLCVSGETTAKNIITGKPEGTDGQFQSFSANPGETAICFAYYIKPDLNRNALSNTVTLQVEKNGTTYNAQVTMRFGTAGSSGSPYTIIIDWDNQQNILDVTNPATAEISGTVGLLDENGEDILARMDSEETPYTVSYSWAVHNAQTQKQIMIQDPEHPDNPDAKIVGSDMRHQFIKENDENKLYPVIFDNSTTFDNLFIDNNSIYDDGNNNLRQDNYYYFYDEGQEQFKNYLSYLIGIDKNNLNNINSIKDKLDTSIQASESKINDEKIEELRNKFKTIYNLDNSYNDSWDDISSYAWDLPETENNDPNDLKKFLKEQIQNQTSIINNEKTNNIFTYYKEYVINNLYNFLLNRDGSKDISGMQTQLNFVYSEIYNKIKTMFNKQSYNYLLSIFNSEANPNNTSDEFKYNFDNEIYAFETYPKLQNIYADYLINQNIDNLIEALYQGFLDRNPDETGRIAWKQLLLTSDNILEDIKKFTSSEEYKNILYRSELVNNKIETLLIKTIQNLHDNNNYELNAEETNLINSLLSNLQNYNTLYDLFYDFIFSTYFIENFDTPINDFISNCYIIFLGREANDDDINVQTTGVGKFYIALNDIINNLIENFLNSNECRLNFSKYFNITSSNYASFIDHIRPIENEYYYFDLVSNSLETIKDTILNYAAQDAYSTEEDSKLYNFIQDLLSNNYQLYRKAKQNETKYKVEYLPVKVYSESADELEFDEELEEKPSNATSDGGVKTILRDFQRDVLDKNEEFYRIMSNFFFNKNKEENVPYKDISNFTEYFTKKVQQIDDIRNKLVLISDDELNEVSAEIKGLYQDFKNNKVFDESGEINPIKLLTEYNRRKTENEDLMKLLHEYIYYIVMSDDIQQMKNLVRMYIQNIQDEVTTKEQEFPDYNYFHFIDDDTFDKTVEDLLDATTNKEGTQGKIDFLTAILNSLTGIYKMTEIDVDKDEGQFYTDLYNLVIRDKLPEKDPNAKYKLIQKLLQYNASGLRTADQLIEDNSETPINEDLIAVWNPESREYQLLNSYAQDFLDRTSNNYKELYELLKNEDKTKLYRLSVSNATGIFEQVYQAISATSNTDKNLIEEAIKAYQTLDTKESEYENLRHGFVELYYQFFINHFTYGNVNINYNNKTIQYTTTYDEQNNPSYNPSIDHIIKCCYEGLLQREYDSSKDETTWKDVFINTAYNQITNGLLNALENTNYGNEPLTEWNINFSDYSSIQEVLEKCYNLLIQKAINDSENSIEGNQYIDDYTVEIFAKNMCVWGQNALRAGLTEVIYGMTNSQEFYQLDLLQNVSSFIYKKLLKVMLKILPLKSGYDNTDKGIYYDNNEQNYDYYKVSQLKNDKIYYLSNNGNYEQIKDNNILKEVQTSNEYSQVYINNKLEYLYTYEEVSGLSGNEMILVPGNQLLSENIQYYYNRSDSMPKDYTDEEYEIDYYGKYYKKILNFDELKIFKKPNESNEFNINGTDQFVYVKINIGEKNVNDILDYYKEYFNQFVGLTPYNRDNHIFDNMNTAKEDWYNGEEKIIKTLSLNNSQLGQVALYSSRDGTIKNLQEQVKNSIPDKTDPTFWKDIITNFISVISDVVNAKQTFIVDQIENNNKLDTLQELFNIDLNDLSSPFNLKDRALTYLYLRYQANGLFSSNANIDIFNSDVGKKYIKFNLTEFLENNSQKNTNNNTMETREGSDWDFFEDNIENFKFKTYKTYYKIKIGSEDKFDNTLRLIDTETYSKEDIYFSLNPSYTYKDENQNEITVELSSFEFNEQDLQYFIDKHYDDLIYVNRGTNSITIEKNFEEINSYGYLSICYDGSYLQPLNLSSSTLYADLFSDRINIALDRDIKIYTKEINFRTYPDRTDENNLLIEILASDEIYDDFSYLNTDAVYNYLISQIFNFEIINKDLLYLCYLIYGSLDHISYSTLLSQKIGLQLSNDISSYLYNNDDKINSFPNDLNQYTKTVIEHIYTSDIYVNYNNENENSIIIPEHEIYKYLTDLLYKTDPIYQNRYKYRLKKLFENESLFFEFTKEVYKENINSDVWSWFNISDNGEQQDYNYYKIIENLKSVFDNIKTDSFETYVGLINDYKYKEIVEYIFTPEIIDNIREAFRLLCQNNQDYISYQHKYYLGLRDQFYKLFTIDDNQIRQAIEIPDSEDRIEYIYDSFFGDEQPEKVYLDWYYLGEFYKKAESYNEDQIYYKLEDGNYKVISVPEEDQNDSNIVNYYVVNVAKTGNLGIKQYYLDRVDNKSIDNIFDYVEIIQNNENHDFSSPDRIDPIFIGNTIYNIYKDVSKKEDHYEPYSSRIFKQYALREFFLDEDIEERYIDKDKILRTDTTDFDYGIMYLPIRERIFNLYKYLLGREYDPSTQEVNYWVRYFFYQWFWKAETNDVDTAKKIFADIVAAFLVSDEMTIKQLDAKEIVKRLFTAILDKNNLSFSDITNLQAVKFIIETAQLIGNTTISIEGEGGLIWRLNQQVPISQQLADIVISPNTQNNLPNFEDDTYKQKLKDNIKNLYKIILGRTEDKITDEELQNRVNNITNYDTLKVQIEELITSSEAINYNNSLIGITKTVEDLQGLNNNLWKAGTFLGYRKITGEVIEYCSEEKYESKSEVEKAEWQSISITSKEYNQLSEEDQKKFKNNLKNLQWYSFIDIASNEDNSTNNLINACNMMIAKPMDLWKREVPEELEFWKLMREAFKDEQTSKDYSPAHYAKDLMNKIAAIAPTLKTYTQSSYVTTDQDGIQDFKQYYINHKQMIKYLTKSAELDNYSFNELSYIASLLEDPAMKVYYQQDEDMEYIYDYDVLSSEPYNLKFFINVDGNYVLDPYDGYRAGVTYYEPRIVNRYQQAGEPLSCNPESGLKAKDFQITPSEGWTTNDLMNSISVLKVTISNFGNYDLEACFPIPLKNGTVKEENQEFEVRYAEGPTDVRYSTSGETDYNNVPYELFVYRSDWPVYDKETGEAIANKTDQRVDKLCYRSDKGPSYHWHLLIPLKQDDDNFNPLLRSYNKERENASYEEDQTINNMDALLRPVVVYIPEASPYGVQFLQDDKILFTQPVWVYEDNYPSTTINNWDGKSIQTDEDTGTIVASGIAAGKKESDNTFTGVMMGDWARTDTDEALTKQTGIYGFNHGAMAYAFKDDGTGFIGKDGRGRIIFDGNKSQIYSNNWNGNDHLGMLMDIDDGYIKMQSKGGTKDDYVLKMVLKYSKQQKAVFDSYAQAYSPDGTVDETVITDTVLENFKIFLSKSDLDNGTSISQKLHLAKIFANIESIGNMDFAFIVKSDTRPTLRKNGSTNSDLKFSDIFSDLNEETELYVKEKSTQMKYITLSAAASKYPLAIGTSKNLYDRKFRVEWDGTTHITDGYFDGLLNAKGGTIGGNFNVTGTLTGGHFVTDVLEANKGQIGGWIIDQTSLTGGTTKLDANEGITTNSIDIYSAKKIGNEIRSISGVIGWLNGRNTVGQPTDAIGILTSSKLILHKTGNEGNAAIRSQTTLHLQSGYKDNFNDKGEYENTSIPIDIYMLANGKLYIKASEIFFTTGPWDESSPIDADKQHGIYARFA